MQLNSFFIKWRVIFVLSIMMAGLITIYVQYAKLAFSPKRPFKTKPHTVERGSIVDRNGKPLAVQTNFYHFGITPKMIKNIAGFSVAVAPALDMNANDIASRITMNKGSNFIYLKKNLHRTNIIIFQK